MNVCLVYSPAPRQTREWQIELAPGSTICDALTTCGCFNEYPELRDAKLSVGVWGKRVDASRLLADHDRVEIYRPLRVDPKVARRERFSRQGARTAGLFSSVRPGGKAGY